MGVDLDFINLIELENSYKDALKLEQQRFMADAQKQLDNALKGIRSAVPIGGGVARADNLQRVDRAEPYGLGGEKFANGQRFAEYINQGKLRYCRKWLAMPLAADGSKPLDCGKSSCINSTDLKRLHHGPVTADNKNDIIEFAEIDKSGCILPQ